MAKKKLTHSAQQVDDAVDGIAALKREIDDLPQGSTTMDAKVAKNAADISQLALKIYGKKEATIFEIGVSGQGDNVIENKNIKNLVAGEQYIFKVNDWAYNGSKSLKFQLFYNDGSTHVVYKVSKGEVVHDYTFVAQANTYYAYQIFADEGQTFDVKIVQGESSSGLVDDVDELKKKTLSLQDEINNAENGIENNKTQIAGKLDARKGLNLFNKDFPTTTDADSDGQEVNLVGFRFDTAGNLISGDGFFVSHKIQVANGNKYTSSKPVSRVVVYDENDEKIDVIGTNISSFEVLNANARYIRIAIPMVSMDLVSVEEGDTATDGQPYNLPYASLQELSKVKEDADKEIKAINDKLGDGGSPEPLYDRSFDGNGDNALSVTPYINNLEVGKIYTLEVNDWSYGNTGKIKFQFFYNENKTNHILVEEKGGVAINTFDFVAEYHEYRINFRADVGVNVNFKVVKKDSSGLIADVRKLKEDVAGLDDKIKNIGSADSMWKGKNIVWFGTSIPAGGENKITFEGNEITVKRGNNNFDVEQQSKTEVYNQYPCIVGSLLGANIYNEAVGSSKIGTKAEKDYVTRTKCLSWSVQDEIAIFLDTWNVNTATKTYSNGARTMGITSFPTVSSWSNVVTQFKRSIFYSYEIKVVARYLIKSQSEHDAYVNKIFGSHKQLAIDMLSSVGQSLTDLCAYKGDMDLFVIDHIHNDGQFGETDSTDKSTYQGGLNMIVREIMRYKPSVRIAMIGDYTNYDASIDRIGMQKAMAERWQFPFIEMSKMLPCQKNAKMLTRGYWDADGVWHDDGFAWSENTATDSYTTNATFNNYIKSTSLSTMKANINPQQIDGTWYWEVYPCYMWCFDGLHPHSDIEGRLNKMYAKVLAKWIEGIGNIL